MSYPRIPYLSTPLTLIILLVVTAAPGHAERLVEDYSATTLRDSAETTVEWNTDLGVLRLPPFAPSQRGSFNTPGLARDVALRDGIAFVADHSAGVQILDVSDPSSPTLLGVFDTPRFALGVATSENLVFVGDSDGGLLVLDVTDLANPVQVGSYDTPGFASDLAVVDDLVFVGDSTDGVQIVSVANPVTPALVSNYDPPQGVVTGVAATRNLMFVAEDVAGLRIVDVQDPFNPTLLSTTIITGGATDVEVRNNVAYVTSGTEGLVVLNVANPISPQLIATAGTPGAARDVGLVGSRALVADGSAGVQAFDVSDPSQPAPLPGYDTFGDARGVVGAGNMAFIAGETSGLQVVQLSAPAAFAYVGGRSSPVLPDDLEVEGDRLAMREGFNVFMLDISDPSAPTPLLTIGVAGLQDVALEEGLLFTAESGIPSSLTIYDVSDEANPVVIGTEATQGTPAELIVTAGFAYLVTFGSSLEIIDVSDPTNPASRGAVALTGLSATHAVAGDLCVVATTSGLEVIDVSDPFNPYIMGSTSNPWNPGGVVILGDVTYVSTEDEVFAYDLSNPAFPALLDQIVLPVTAFFERRKMAGFDNSLYLAGQRDGIIEIDASDPQSLRFVQSDDIFGGDDIWDVALGDDVVIVASESAGFGFEGLRVLDRFQTEVARAYGVGQSLSITDPDRYVAAAAVRSQVPSTVLPFLSANGSPDFTVFPPSPSGWLVFPQVVASRELRWKLEFEWESGESVEVDSLEVEVFYAGATISSVEDIPGDQGGRVAVTFDRSGLEFGGTPLPLAGYNVLRRVDTIPLAAAKRLQNGSPLRSIDGKEVFPMPGATVWRTDEGDYLEATELPPGPWIVVGSVFPMGLFEYTVEVTTGADAVATDYIVAASSNPAFFSPIVSGSSIDNIAPGVPTNLVATPGGGLVALNWDDATETDFQFHRVYRGATSDFTPAEANRLGETAGPAFVDNSPSGAEAFYRVTTIDYAGNESASQVVQADFASSVPGARSFALHGARPNPFNPSTRIAFELDRTSAVQLLVFDVAGRRVRTLVDEVRSAGSHEVVWHGRDDRQRSVASGIYFLRLMDGERSSLQRVGLVK